MKSRKKYYSILILLLGMQLFSASHEEAERYKSAYQQITQENWQEAQNQLSLFIHAFPNSAYVDDARFWQCYAKEKLDQDPEAAFHCYDEFSRNYKDSKWADDAQKHMLRLANELSRHGKPEYLQMVASIQSSENKELAITAIHALRNMENSKALDALITLYDSHDDVEIRDKIIFVFSEYEDPRAGAKLREIAQNDSSSKLRKQALFWLAQKNQSEDDLLFIASIAKSDQDREVRKQAVFALSEAPNDKGIPYILEIAKSEKDLELRKQAIFWLGQNCQDQQIIEFLKQVAMTDEDEEIAKQAVFALSEISADKGLPLLVEIAKSRVGHEVRKQAIFWLGQNARSDEIIEEIKTIALKESDSELAKQAVFALGEVPDGKGLMILREIAKQHNNTEVRKEAVFWIGDNAHNQSDVDFLKSIVDHDEDYEVQKQAIFAIAETDELGLPTLIQIAKSHPDKNMRKQAIFWLGESDDPRASEALLEIITDLK